MSLLDETFLVIDTETTGLDPKVDRVVDIGAVLIKNGKIEKTWETTINPGIPIPPQASAIHHLTDEHVAESPSLESIADTLTDLADGASVIAAHNAEFDRPFIPTLSERPWMCTLRLSRHLWPSAPAHGNQVLRYWLKLKVDLDGKNTHRALPDALVTVKVLGAEIETYLENGGKDNAMALMEYIKLPITVQKMTFGKEHYGKSLSEVPSSYLQWALSDGAYDIVKQKLRDDPDLKWSIEKTLQNRK